MEHNDKRLLKTGLMFVMSHHHVAFVAPHINVTVAIKIFVMFVKINVNVVWLVCG